VQRETFQFATAFSKFEQAGTQRNIVVIKGVEKFQGKDGFSVGSNTGKGIQETVASGCASGVELAED